jgi:hypothetical protein
MRCFSVIRRARPGRAFGREAWGVRVIRRARPERLPPRFRGVGGGKGGAVQSGKIRVRFVRGGGETWVRFVALRGGGRATQAEVEATVGSAVGETVGRGEGSTHTCGSTTFLSRVARRRRSSAVTARVEKCELRARSNSVQLVRRGGRDVSTLYGRGGGRAARTLQRRASARAAPRARLRLLARSLARSLASTHLQRGAARRGGAGRGGADRGAETERWSWACCANTARTAGSTERWSWACCANTARTAGSTAPRALSAPPRALSAGAAAPPPARLPPSVSASASSSASSSASATATLRWLALRWPALRWLAPAEERPSAEERSSPSTKNWLSTETVRGICARAHAAGDGTRDAGAEPGLASRAAQRRGCKAARHGHLCGRSRLLAVQNHAPMPLLRLRLVTCVRRGLRRGRGASVGRRVRRGEEERVRLVGARLHRVLHADRHSGRTKRWR